jgi:hypothetical protein
MIGEKRNKEKERTKKELVKEEINEYLPYTNGFVT